MWWDDPDDDFRKFLVGLIGTEPLGPKAPIKKKPEKKVAPDALSGAISASTSGAKKVGDLGSNFQATPTPSPSASPSSQPTVTPSSAPTASASSSPSPTSSPAPTGSSPVTNDLGAIKADVGDPVQRQGQGKIGGLDPNAPVYDGHKKTQIGPVGEFAPKIQKGTPGFRPLSEVAGDPYEWSEQKVRDVAKLMVDAGYMSPKDIVDRANVAKWWTYLASTAAQMWSRGNFKVTPLDLLKRQAYGLPGTGTGIGGGPKTVTSTSTQYTVTNATTAKQLAQAALSQRVGRAATDAEVAEFIAALRKEEKANPQVTKATTTTNADGTSQTSTSTVREGVDVAAFQRQWTDGYNTEEAKAYQAAGIMMPWFFEALRAPA